MMNFHLLLKMIKAKINKYCIVKRYKKGYKFTVPLRNNYFITTELGIFHLARGQIRLLTNKPGYGLAIDKDSAYFSYEDNQVKFGKLQSSSKVIRANVHELIRGCFWGTRSLRSQKTLFCQPFTSNNGRIHQMNFSNYGGGGELLIAASNENAIVRIEIAGTNTKISAIHPFADSFGVPIKNFDHNHINSAIRIGNVIYFVAYKAGHSSFIGYLENNSVYGYRVKPSGFHDFFPTSTGFITCDTFGNAELGMVLNEDGSLRRNFFLKNDFAPRGVSGDEQELLVGHSHKGPRNKRFKGNGGIIIFKNCQEPEYFPLPSSQVYQIMREDGAYLMPLENCSHQKMKDKLDRRFGPSVKIGLYSEEDISWNNENE